MSKEIQCEVKQCESDTFKGVFKLLYDTSLFDTFEINYQIFEKGFDLESGMPFGELWVSYQNFRW